MTPLALSLIISDVTNETVICTYRVRPADEASFAAILAGHWGELRRLGFVTDEPAQVFRQVDEPTYVEVFTWVEGGFEQAHEHPDVLVLWERMDPLLEERDGRPKWEFPHYRRLDPGS